MSQRERDRIEKEELEAAAAAWSGPKEPGETFDSLTDKLGQKAADVEEKEGRGLKSESLKYSWALAEGAKQALIPEDAKDILVMAAVPGAGRAIRKAAGKIGKVLKDLMKKAPAKGDTKIHYEFWSPREEATWKSEMPARRAERPLGSIAAGAGMSSLGLGLAETTGRSAPSERPIQMFDVKEVTTEDGKRVMIPADLLERLTADEEEIKVGVGPKKSK